MSNDLFTDGHDQGHPLPRRVRSRQGPLGRIPRWRCLQANVRQGKSDNLEPS